MSIIDLSKDGLIKAGKGALVGAVLTSAFKLFTKTHPQLMRPDEEKGAILGAATTISVLDILFSSAQASSPNKPVIVTNGGLGFFVSSLLTSVVVDKCTYKYGLC